jgi:hypothetical protein
MYFGSNSPMEGVDRSKGGSIHQSGTMLNPVGWINEMCRLSPELGPEFGGNMHNRFVISSARFIRYTGTIPHTGTRPPRNMFRPINRETASIPFFIFTRLTGPLVSPGERLIQKHR